MGKIQKETLGMKQISITFLAIVGAYSTMEGLLVLAKATSAMTAIYGSTMLTCAAVCAGFIGVLAIIRGDK